MPIGGQKKQKIKLSSDPEGTLYTEGFGGGLNTLTSPQHIANNECSALLNAQISEDGVITRRAGSTQYDGTGTDGTRVLGLYPFTTYDSSGVRTSTLLKVDNSGNLKKWSGSVWSTLSGFTFQAGNLVEFAQSSTTCYLVDGKNPLATTDGSTVTTFSGVTDPSGGLSLATVGSAGQTPYSYSYTYTTQYGETKPCATVTITTGNQTLNSTNYNQLTITRGSDSHITGYNVYGNKSGYLFYLGFVPQTTSGNITFNDQGATPNTAFAAPIGNTTQGPVGSMIAVFHDTILMAGDPTAPSTLRYSAGLDRFDSFQLVDGAGFIQVNPEDGDRITAIVVYKNSLFVFKNRSIYQFEFGTGSNLATITIVNPSIGCAAKRTAKVVLNDVYFLSPAGAVFTLGYQQGVYGVGVADLLRTNEVSIKIHPTLASINTAQIASAAALYTVTNYNYVLAYADGSSTYNNKLAVYDSRYGAWVQWDNMNINCMTSFISSTNQEMVLYGDDNTGKVVQMYTGSSDQGGAFTFRMKTKDFNAGAFHLLKTWIWPTFHFRNILGAITTTVITDGAQNVSTVSIGSTTSYTGWSFDRWANFRWGTTAGGSASATSSDAPRQKNIRIDARSIMFLFEDTSASDSFSILGVESRYITRVGRRLPSQYIIN